MDLFVIYSNSSENFLLKQARDEGDAITIGKLSGQLGAGHVGVVKLVELPEIKVPEVEGKSRPKTKKERQADAANPLKRKS